MDPLVAHQRAQDTFARVLANVTSDQLSSPTPCPEWDVKALVEHVIAGNLRVVARAGGQVAPLPEDLGGAHRASAKAAQETFTEPQALTRTYRLPIGEVPGTAFIELRTSDLLAHAWDLAVATGQPSDLDPELAEYVLAFSNQMMSRPGLHGDGRPYGEEKPCDDERPAADRDRGLPRPRAQLKENHAFHPGDGGRFVTPQPFDILSEHRRKPSQNPCRLRTQSHVRSGSMLNCLSQ